jgi:hypothetical protein
MMLALIACGALLSGTSWRMRDTSAPAEVVTA